MGLYVDVYRHPGFDSTGNGVSARHDRLFVVNVDGPPHDPERLDGNTVALIDGHRPGDKIIVPVINCAEPGEEPEWQAVSPDGHVGPMNGGNFAAASDGRWCRAVGFYGAVPIHDRYETTAEYATYD